MYTGMQSDSILIPRCADFKCVIFYNLFAPLFYQILDVQSIYIKDLFG